MTKYVSLASAVDEDAGLPGIGPIWHKVISADQIYHAGRNEVYELPSYTLIWSGPYVDLTAGAAAAQRAAYALRERVYIASY